MDGWMDGWTAGFARDCVAHRAYSFEGLLHGSCASGVSLGSGVAYFSILLGFLTSTPSFMSSLNPKPLNPRPLNPKPQRV